MQSIPFSTLPAFTQTVDLDGVVYRLSFAWNYRGSFWGFSILDAAGAPLVQGIRVVLNIDLLRQYPGRGLPPGILYAVDPSDKIGDPAFDDLSSGRVTLVYITEAERAI